MFNVENTRVKKSVKVNDTITYTTTYTHNANSKLSQLLMKTENGVTTYYVYGRGLIGEEVNGAFKTYHFDYRGSTVALTDSTGNVTDTFEYDTYGSMTARTGTTVTPFLYNGRDGVMSDENGLVYMRARYYSPVLKRFINADVVAGSITNSITLNRYAYANGNPVSNIDPFGLSAERGGGSGKKHLPIAFGVDPFAGTTKPSISPTISQSKASSFLNWLIKKYLSQFNHGSGITFDKYELGNLKVEIEAEWSLNEADIYSLLTGETGGSDSSSNAIRIEPADDFGFRVIAPQNDYLTIESELEIEGLDTLSYELDLNFAYSDDTYAKFGMDMDYTIMRQAQAPALNPCLVPVMADPMLAPSQAIATNINSNLNISTSSDIKLIKDIYNSIQILVSSFAINRALGFSGGGGTDDRVFTTPFGQKQYCQVLR